MVDLRKKILLVGSVPPPIGGVSIHLFRLINRMKYEKIDFDFFDYKRDELLSFIKILNVDLVHTNYSNKIIRFLTTLFLRVLKKKVVITFHGKYSFTNIFDFLTLKLLNKGLVLNEYSYINAIAKIADKDRIKIISAFIPPGESEEVLTNRISNGLDSFFSRYKSVACTNAHTYVLNKEGKDLYGVDFLLKVFSENSEYGLIISDPSGNLINKYSKFTKLDNILFISEPHSFIEIIKRSNIFVRATTTDGDSLSVKEALYFKTKVIASDCVDRPIGCILYKTGDAESFLESLSSKEDSSSRVEIKDGSNEIIKIYKLLLNIKS